MRGIENGEVERLIDRAHVGAASATLHGEQGRSAREVAGTLEQISLAVDRTARARDPITPLDAGVGTERWDCS